MATRYRFGDSQYPHFITFAVVNWIDALSRPVYKDIFAFAGVSRKALPLQVFFTCKQSSAYDLLHKLADEF